MKKFFTGLLIVLPGLLLLCHSPKALAAPYVRVKKNGIIYYFFSQRDYLNKTRVRSFITRKPRVVRSRLARKICTREIQPVIDEASRHHNLPPSLIKAIIRVESNFNPSATSPKGAQGLMQLMPATAAHLRVSNPYDIKENIWAGTRYFFKLLRRFNHSLPHALAAYNAGPHRVDRYQAVPPIIETQDFVRDVCTHFLKYQEKNLTSSERR